MVNPVTRKSVLPLVLLESAAGLSTCANAMIALALPWLVLERTGSPAFAGVIAAATTLPMLLGSVFAGTIVDLVGSRRTAITADLLSAGSVAAVAVMDLTGAFSLPVLAVLAFVGSLFDLSGVTARKVLLPTVATRAGKRLETVNGIHELVKATALVAGPALSGLLIGTAGVPVALAVAAVAPALAALSTLQLPASGRMSLGSSPFRATWRGASDGLSAVWRDPLLRLTGLTGIALYVVYLPIVGIVLPTYFNAQNAPEHLGLLNVTFAVGGIAGALGYTFWGHKVGRRSTFVVAMLTGAAGLLAMSVLPAYSVLLALAAVVGMAAGPVGPLMNLASQLRSTEQMRGRVMGIMTSVGYVGGPVGYLIGGPLVDHLGPQTAFAILASVLFVLAVGAAVQPALREFDSLSATSSAGAR
ncbi:MFS transporter [Kibdelosporangium phytohabitans]|nr:MFS transporter [Kibdelosporangium phytohabitans]MBE1465724.1 MFS family permease [Kibdelosporangium phytohabitans]